MSAITNPPSRTISALRRIKSGGVKKRVGKGVYVGVAHTLHNREDALTMPVSKREDAAEKEPKQVIPVRVTEIDDVLEHHVRLSDHRGLDLGWFHLDLYSFYRPIELLN